MEVKSLGLIIPEVRSAVVSEVVYLCMEKERR